MNEKMSKDETMKDVTQAFMSVLMSVEVQDNNIKAITQLLWGDFERMDKLIEFIKKNPKATESDIIREAVRISKN